MNSEILPNSRKYLAPKIIDRRISLKHVWGMLSIRSALSFFLLLLLALVFKLGGSSTAIKASSAWWLWFVTITNITCLILLLHLCRKESLRLQELFFFNPSTWKADLRWFLMTLAGTAIFAQLPGNLLAKLLWGDVNLPNSLLIQPLPLLAIYPLIILMPVTQALAELPTYWGYVAPRLRASGLNRWLVIGGIGFTLSIQHMFFSFQLDWRYDLWLALKYLPFALWMGFVIDRRPTVLPYLMVMHFLLDASLPVLLLFVSKGIPLV
jgi:hypothetical protein